MKARRHYIESITDGMYAIKREFLRQGFAKVVESGKPCLPVKNDAAHITSSQWAVLAIIIKKGGDVGIKEITTELGITSSATTQFVDGLVNKGYLVRKDNAADRRIRSVTLSDKHKKNIDNMRAKSIKQFAAMFDALTNKELAQYAALNKKIVDSILQRSSNI